MITMPTAEIYTLLLAGLLIAGVLWVVTRFIDRDSKEPCAGDSAGSLRRLSQLPGDTALSGTRPQ